MISELEKSIAKYKEEYALLISEAQTIKADLNNVETKVARSTGTIHSPSLFCPVPISFQTRAYLFIYFLLCRKYKNWINLEVLL